MTFLSFLTFSVNEEASHKEESGGYVTLYSVSNYIKRYEDAEDERWGRWGEDID